jgi:hypothetical protein
LKRQEHFVVETTKVGIVNNALSYLNNVSTKSHFVFCVIQGLGGIFKLDVRNQLASYVMNLGGEKVPDKANPLLNYYDPKSGSWMVFAPEAGQIKIEDLKN